MDISARGCRSAIGDKQLRWVLGNVATGVMVVTALAGDTQVGMTANSFTSVSLDPPLVLICVGRGSPTGRRIIDSGAFAVNVLSGAQQELARHFAASAPNRFAGVECRPGLTGSPLLAEAMAYLDCRIIETLERGDHGVVIGAVVDMGAIKASDPLIFFRGSYWSGRALAAGRGASLLNDEHSRDGQREPFCEDVQGNAAGGR